MRTIARPVVFYALFGTLLCASCADRTAPEAGPDTEQVVRAVVERFGEQMRGVPLLAPDSVLTEQLRAAYDTLVTDALLQSWLAHPEEAPGRAVSSPWPASIAIGEMRNVEPGHYRVEGEILYQTSVEKVQGGAVARRGVVLQLRRDHEAWRISGIQVGAWEDQAP